MRSLKTMRKQFVDAHIAVGIVVILFFYMAVYFGTLTLFMPYIDMWQNPSRHFSLPKDKDIALESVVNRGLIALGEPNSSIEISLPSFRDNAISMHYQHSENIYFDPYTVSILETKYENHFLTEFFNEIHIGRNIPFIGQLCMGLASIGMLFLIINGIYLWITSKQKIKKSSLYKWHKNLSLMLTPYIIVFSMTEL